MLAVGTLGFPYIGALQANERIDAVKSDQSTVAAAPGLLDEKGELTVTEDRTIYEVILYPAINDKALDAKTDALPAGAGEQV